MSRRSDELKQAASDFLEVHNAWVADKNKPTPDEVYWDAVDSLVEVFDDDVPGTCRALAASVDGIKTERDVFDHREDMSALYPEDKFWEAVEILQTEFQAFDRKAAPLPALESIASLKQLPHITDSQIAKIWGFKDRFGNYATQFVQQELDKPGSITQTPGAMDGQDWVDPREARRGKGKVNVAKQAEALAEKGKAARKSKKPVNESPKDLWEQSLTPKQAAKVLGMDEEEVSTLFAGFVAERDAALESGYVVSSQTQAIRELAAQGKGATAIAKELKLDKKVVAEALQKEPAA